jgi:hypothetical protein
MTLKSEPNALLRFYNWLTLNDYVTAKEEATDLVVKRLSRGNTSTQNGWYLDWIDLTSLSKAGDKAMRRLKRMVAA